MAVPAIMGWSVMSPLGIGRREFSAALLDGGGGGGGQGGRNALAGDLAETLGPRGTRTLDRMTMMVIATTGLVLREHAAALGPAASTVGLVLGTSTGCVASTTAFLRDSFVQARPYFVNPMHFPNTVMNGAAGQTAIWHGLRGLNSTIAAGHLTGLAALRYASRMIRSGYAETLLVGCVEEVSEPVSAAATVLRRADPEAVGPLGEGCVVFLLDSTPGRTPLAEVVDFEIGVAAGPFGPQAWSARLARCIQTVLRRNALTGEQLWLVSQAHGDTRLGAAERAAIDAVLPRPGRHAGPRRFVAAERTGDCFSAQGALQLAAVLALAERTGPAGPGRLALLTSVGADGAVGCALVRG